MIVIENTESLEILLDAAPATNQLSWIASVVAASGGTYVQASSEEGVTTGVTPVTVISGAASTQKRVMALSVFNLDTASRSVTFRLGTGKKFITATIVSGGTLQYEAGSGWSIYDSNGILQAVYSTNNLTGHITSVGAATVLGSFTKSQLDTAVSDGNILYVGDVTSNATHTGDATGSGALLVVGINNVIMSTLGTGILKNTTTTGVPSIAIAGTDYLTPSGSAAALTSFPTLNQNTTGNAATVTTNANLTGPVTSTGNATAIANGAISNAMLANGAVANLSNTNSGDQTSIVGITGTKAQFDTAVTDGNFAYQSDLSSYATTVYVDNSVIGLLDSKGPINCSANPNYPSALKGDLYHVTVAGKIGGASGVDVEIGDAIVASADNAGGTHAAVGSSWFILEHNLNGAVLIGGALGTPSSGNLTNCTFPTLNQSTTGSAASLTTPRTIGGVSFNGTADIAPQTITVVNEAADTTCFVTFVTAATGDLQQKTNAALTFNSSTVSLACTTFVGALTGNATTVTTNANLTGHITSTGNAAILGSFTKAQLDTAVSDGDVVYVGNNITGSAATLTTPRTINGTSFDGSANISVTGSDQGASIVAASAAINTVETLLVKTSALPANRLVAGTTLRVTLWGTCTSTAANVSTFRIRIGTNGTTADGVVQTVATAVAATTGTAVTFTVTFDIVIRTTGASATSHGSMTLLNSGTTGIAAQTTQNILPTFATFNTTTANNVISITYQAAAATTTTTFQGANIEIVYK